MSTAEELGDLSYQKANWNDFQGAIDVLNTAVSKFPHDARLYNNRCYCYCRLKDFNNALKDANHMVKFFPNYIKSHYRRGDVLFGLKDYVEAENEFRKVLALDPDCEEAKTQLLECQIQQVQEVGCYRFVALEALQMTSGVYQAKQFIESGGAKYIANEVEIYFSDEEVLETTPPGSESAADPYTDPRNLMNSKTLWVGNITKNVTEEMLKHIFKQYGQVKSIVLQHKKYCAFVNYTSPTMATNAMRRFEQNTPIADTKLIIRFPDNLSRPRSGALANKRVV